MKEDFLEERLGDILVRHHLLIGVAESATGGLISHRITSIPGSSEYFKGSIIAYSNQIKTKLLGVKTGTIKNFGAVSYETSIEMAKGVMRLMSADIGLASTGIAGPAGGTLEKPVGLVYIGLATKDISKVRKYIFSGNRGENKKSFSEAALNLLNEYLSTL